MENRHSSYAIIRSPRDLISCSVEGLSILLCGSSNKFYCPWKWLVESVTGTVDFTAQLLQIKCYWQHFSGVIVCCHLIGFHSAWTFVRSNSFTKNIFISGLYVTCAPWPTLTTCLSKLFANREQSSSHFENRIFLVGSSWSKFISGKIYLDLNLKIQGNGGSPTLCHLGILISID